MSTSNAVCCYQNLTEEQGERLDSGKEENMFTRAIALVIATLGIMVWLFRRQHVCHRTITGEDSETRGDQSKDKDELADTQAAEVVATWNLLNPP
jgi:hypothetical protein